MVRLDRYIGDMASYTRVIIGGGVCTRLKVRRRGAYISPTHWSLKREQTVIALLLIALLPPIILLCRPVVPMAYMGEEYFKLKASIIKYERFILKVGPFDLYTASLVILYCIV